MPCSKHEKNTHHQHAVQIPGRGYRGVGPQRGGQGDLHPNADHAIIAHRHEGRLGGGRHGRGILLTAGLTGGCTCQGGDHHSLPFNIVYFKYYYLEIYYYPKSMEIDKSYTSSCKLGMYNSNPVMTTMLDVCDACLSHMSENDALLVKCTL